MASKSTGTITIRLPNDVIETLHRRAKNNYTTIGEYARGRLVYDTRRKHKRAKKK